MDLKFFESQIKAFKECYPDFKQLLIDQFEISAESEIFKQDFSEILDFYFLGSRQTRAGLLLGFYHTFSDLGLKQQLKEQIVSDEKVKPKSAYFAAWCLEMFHSFALAADDICDNAEERRNQPAAYKKYGLGTTIADVLLGHNLVYRLLGGAILPGSPISDNLLDFLHEELGIIGCSVVIETKIGKKQLYLDKDFAESFDIEDYCRKRCSYGFWGTACLGILLAGFDANSALVADAKAIFDVINAWYQIQDDYLDVFGDPVKMLKKGVDIKTGLLTWCIITAVRKADKADLKILSDNYGKNDDAAEATVIEVFKKLGLPEIYKKTEEDLKLMMQTGTAAFQKKYSISADIFHYIIKITIKKRI